jgi:hypothetical protein
MASGGGMMSGVVDPETIYTKQNCIGRSPSFVAGEAILGIDVLTGQVVVALERYTKGMTHSQSANCSWTYMLIVS